MRQTGNAYRTLSSFGRRALVAGLMTVMSFSLAALPAFAKKEKLEDYDAYVIIGYLNQKWYRQFGTATFAATGLNADVYQDVEPLVQKKARELKALGYKVHIVRQAVKEQFKTCLTNPKTKAIAWFGHGEEGSPGSVEAFAVSDAGVLKGDTISPGELKQWAAEKWARKNGWDGKGSPGDWLWAKYENADQRNKKIAEMQAATHNLEYGYFHTCYGFDTKALPSIMMKHGPSAKAFGFKGIKRWFDEEGVSQAAVIGGIVEVGAPKIIEPKRQVAEAAQAKSSGLKLPEKPKKGEEADPDLEEVAIKPQKAGKPIAPPKKEAEVANDPDLEEVKVATVRSRSGGGNTGSEDAGSGKVREGRKTKEKEKSEERAKNDSGVKPNLVRTSWRGEMTIQDEGAPPQVFPFTVSIDSSNAVAGSFRMNLFPAEEENGVREIRLTGRYDSRSGKLDFTFDGSYAKPQITVYKVPDFVTQNGMPVQIGEHDERLVMNRSVRVWGELAGIADSGDTTRGEVTIREQSTWTSEQQPKIAAGYSDKEPSVSQGTWRANKVK